MSTILSIDELLQRVGIQPEDGNDWFVLTLPFGHHGALAEDLGDVLEIFRGKLRWQPIRAVCRRWRKWKIVCAIGCSENPIDYTEDS
jgi:hypothetical protein